MEITPFQIGARLSPPQLVIEFKTRLGSDESTLNRSRYLCIGLKQVLTTDVQQLASKLQKRFPCVFNDIQENQITRILEKICTLAKSRIHEETTQDGKHGNKQSSISGGFGDLQTVSPHKLAFAKAVMESDFQHHAVKPGDAQWQYDKRIDFVSNNAANEWDDSADSITRPTHHISNNSQDEDSVGDAYSDSFDDEDSVPPTTAALISKNAQNKTPPPIIEHSNSSHRPGDEINSVTLENSQNFVEEDADLLDGDTDEDAYEDEIDQDDYF